MWGFKIVERSITEATEVQEHAEDLFKKGLIDRDNHNVVVTHLEPDILDCEVRWALGSIPTLKS